MSDKKNISVFYSWQSDSKSSFNKNYILNQLEKAAKEENERDANHEFKIDESTRGEPGSPEILETVLGKISSSDIFVCDVTPVFSYTPKSETASSSKGTDKGIPNANVLIELGYAMAYLGWQRIIMICNKLNDYPNAELPFDIPRKRITYYSKDGSANSDSLKSSLKKALKTIVSKNPVTPWQQDKNEIQVKRRRDINAFESIFNVLPVRIAQQYFYLDTSICTHALNVMNSINDLFNDPLFHVSDPFAKNLIGKMKRSSCELIDLVYFEPHDNGWLYRLQGGMNSAGRQNAANEVHRKRAALTNFLQSMYKLVQYIKSTYTEIDLDEINARAEKNIPESEF